MIALIAEKPSVAKDIARIIGATQKNDGYLSGNGYLNPAKRNVALCKNDTCKNIQKRRV